MVIIVSIHVLAQFFIVSSRPRAFGLELTDVTLRNYEREIGRNGGGSCHNSL
jgi:hypothetical protein